MILYEFLCAQNGIETNFALELLNIKNTMVICPFRLTTIVLKLRCFYNVNFIN